MRVGPGEKVKVLWSRVGLVRDRFYWRRKNGREVRYSLPLKRAKAKLSLSLLLGAQFNKLIEVLVAFLFSFNNQA